MHRLHFPLPCPSFLHNHNFQSVNHQYNDYFNWYHFHNLPILRKIRGVLCWQPFYKSVTVYSCDIFLGLTVSTIGSFIINKLYGVFFLLLFLGINIWSGVTLAKNYPCLEKSEASKLCLWIFISEGFSIWVHLLDLLVTGIDLDLYALSTMSFSLSLEVSTVYGDVYDLFVFLNVSIFYFCGDKRCVVFLNHISLDFSTVSIVSIFFCWGDWCTIFIFLCFFEGTEAWSYSTS